MKRLILKMRRIQIKMMSLRKIGFILSLSLVLASCTEEKKKIYYVDLVKTFNEFQLSKELKELTDNESRILTSKLDSLELELNTSKSGTQKYQDDLNFYYKLKESSSLQIENTIAQSDQKIWQQLNRYFTEYGESEGLSILLGGKADGSVLYIEEALDLTDEFLEFANSKYEGE